MCLGFAQLMVLQSAALGTAAVLGSMQVVEKAAWSADVQAAAVGDHRQLLAAVQPHPCRQVFTTWAECPGSMSGRAQSWAEGDAMQL